MKSWTLFSFDPSRFLSLSSKILLLFICFFFYITAPTSALTTDELLSDPSQEARARRLSLEFRCLVCQNESLDESLAPLAKDLRTFIRNRIRQGASDEAIRSDLLARYGEFILMKPRFHPQTWILWFAPWLLLGLGTFVIVRRLKRPE